MPGNESGGPRFDGPRRVTGRARITFGKNLRTARVAANMSQERLAGLVGMDQPYLSSVETGAQNITLDTAEAIASAVGQPLHVLLRPTR